MQGKTYIIIASFQVVILLLFANINAAGLWQTPFDTTSADTKPDYSTLSLDNALSLVAAENPSFKSFQYQIQAANANLKQAGLWSNPEIEMEIEEFGWDAPGFKESEFTVALSQEFEFFGQRGARKKAAYAQIDAIEFQVKISAFDLYLITKERYYALAHGIQNVALNKKSVDLAKDIVENINHRLEKGAALKSELILANLEEQQALLELQQSRQNVLSLETSLVSLWKAKPSGTNVIYGPEDDLAQLLNQIGSMSSSLDSTRDMMQLQNEMNLLSAEKNLAIAEARPAITLSGGFKRFEFDNSKSFLFGVSMPIPFFNRNQGTQKSIEAQLHSMRYEIEKEKDEIESIIESLIIQLNQLKERHDTLDRLLLPTAEDAYQTLKSAYDAGRIPYTQLLEAKRILNDFSFEHNDIILAIHLQIIELESLTGTMLYAKKEN